VGASTCPYPSERSRQSSNRAGRACSGSRDLSTPTAYPFPRCRQTRRRAGGAGGEWVKTQPEDRDPFRPDLTGFEVVPIETKAGDLVIWHSMLPHGTRRNNAKIPRLAQYITMSPAQEDNEEDRHWRIKIWRDRLPPGGRPFPGDARRLEEDHGTTAELTPLGRKLLGVDRWDA
jgi:Phytanoyl-CoA dioxygenase (PhyH)